jgi:hypothetical protein
MSSDNIIIDPSLSQALPKAPKKAKKPSKAGAAKKTAPPTSASWSAAEEKLLVEWLQDAKDEGMQAEAGWKPQVWTNLEVRFITRGPPDSGCVKNAGQIKSKFANVSGAI